MVSRLIWLVIFCGILMGCLGAPKTKYIVVAFDPALRMAVQVDLVTAQPEATSVIPVDGAGWFRNKGALMASFGDRIAVKNMELVPGYAAEDVKWAEIKSTKPQYFIFVNWGHKAKRYSFDTVPEYLLVGVDDLKMEIPANLIQ